MLHRTSRPLVTVLATLLAIAGASFGAVASAQKIAAPPVERWQRPQLTIANGADLPVRLQQVAVKSEISGRLAVTEIAMTFFNPNGRILEGEHRLCYTSERACLRQLIRGRDDTG